MIASPELFVINYSMDGCNRGYGAGIGGLAEARLSIERPDSDIILGLGFVWRDRPWRVILKA
ncbi:hypothetical protein M2360_005288 [Rhizobium sp. SG_E_25_P2]|uniref:hypothetical protein n=1 Tax=Rhizobium sp. SG_E_25_P2 TaxID=2879942 RepID=UPI0024742634|nr:hypothetical protein [Rhizobium sp. SG_E_25_P2]MDH6269856.1 hypothetical protein [Rhizobium sp. SG_E_25_P2]